MYRGITLPYASDEADAADGNCYFIAGHSYNSLCRPCHANRIEFAPSIGNAVRDGHLCPNGNPTCSA